MTKISYGYVPYIIIIIVTVIVASRRQDKLKREPVAGPQLCPSDSTLTLIWKASRVNRTYQHQHKSTSYFSFIPE